MSIEDIYADAIEEVQSRVDEGSRSIIDRAARYRKGLVAAVTAAVVAVGHLVGVDSSIYAAAVAAAGVVGVVVVPNAQR